MTVNSNNGNTVIAGTLNANSSADIAGDFSIASNKLTVESSTGNTLIAGTLTK